MIDMSKKYKTRDGQSVRILCTDGPFDRLPVVGFVGNELYTWAEDGKFIERDRENSWDLIEVSPYADWPINEPIWVRDADDCESTWVRSSRGWYPRYFAGVEEDGRVKAWANGATSFSADNPEDVVVWDEARRAREFTPSEEESR